jgi:hypothetical protein
MTNIKTKTQIVDEESGIMLRVDKTLKEMMEEKPSSRWNVNYWHLRYTKILEQISSLYKLKTVDQILNTSIIAPDHVRASKTESIGKNFSCEYRTLKDLMFTGLNYATINYCSDNAYQRLKRTQLKVGDILFAGSGIGAIGRLGIVEYASNQSCVGDLFILRNPKINRYYLYLFLLTIFGQSQIERIFHGIQSAKISVSEIGSIKIVILLDTTQKNIEKEYLKISKFHNRAMESKKRGDEKGYKNNLEIAEKMLRDLIEKTEQVIRGERNDVV